MSTNCLVTRLNRVVNNDTLPFLNGMKIKATPFTSTHYINIYSGSPLKYKILNNAFSFTDENGVSRGEYETIVPAGSTLYAEQYGIPANSEGTILVTNKNTITEISIGGNQGGFSINTEEFIQMSSLTYLGFVKLIGDIGNLKDCHLREIYSVNNSLLVGSLADWKHPEDTTLITLFGTGISGDIRQFAKFVNASKIWISNTEVKGTVESLVEAFSDPTIGNKPNGSIDVAFNNGYITYQGNVITPGSTTLTWVNGEITSFPV